MPHRQTRFASAATAFLVIALTLSGIAFMAIPVIAMKLLLPRLLPADSPLFRLLGVSPSIELLAILAFALPVVLVGRRNWRWIGGSLLAALCAVAISVAFQFVRYPLPPDASPWPPLAIFAAATSLVVVSSLFYTAWLGRITAYAIPPAMLFAFFFLGCMLGVFGYPSLMEPKLTMAQQLAVTAILLAFVWIAFLGIHSCLCFLTPIDEVSFALTPTWLRRFRWILLGALPGCVALGATTHITTELSPIPLMWIVPIVMCQFAWVVALARMSSPTPTRTAWLVQILAVLLLVSFAGILLGISGDFAPTQDFIWCLLTLLALLAALLIPHRITLPLQALLFVAVLMQIYQIGPFAHEWTTSIFPWILLHLLSCAVIAWGCFGDAARDAPPDRLPEFMLCVQGGFLISATAFRVLPPLVFPDSWGIIEYPLVLAVALLVRLLIWPTSGTRRRVSKSETSGEGHPAP